MKSTWKQIGFASITLVLVTANLHSIAKRNVSQDVISHVQLLREELSSLRTELKSANDRIEQYEKVDREIITNAERLNYHLKKIKESENLNQIR